VQTPLRKCARSVCTLPAIFAAPRTAGGPDKQPDAGEFRVAEPAHMVWAHGLGQASECRGAVPAHVVKAHDTCVLESRVAEPAHETDVCACGEHVHRDVAAAGARGRLWAHAPGSFAEETDHLPSRGVSDFVPCGSESTVAAYAVDRNHADDMFIPNARSGGIRHACTSANEQDAAQWDDFSFWPEKRKSAIGSTQPDCADTNMKTVLPPSVAVAKAMGVPALRFSGLLNGYPVTILVDSGAERDCASKSFVERHGLNSIDPEKSDVLIQLADGQVKMCGILEAAQFQLGKVTDSCDFAVTELQGEDLILGMPWLMRRNPQPDWRKRTLYLKYQGEKHCIPAIPIANTPIPVVSAMEFVTEVRNNNPA